VKSLTLASPVYNSELNEELINQENIQKLTSDKEDQHTLLGENIDEDSQTSRIRSEKAKKLYSDDK